MIGSIRKHSAWLWAIIITAVIVSFVFTFNPGARNGNSGQGAGNLGTIDGHSISQADYVTARHNSELRYFTSTHQWPGRGANQSDFDLDRDTYQQLFLAKKIEDFHVTVDSDSMAMVARRILADFGQGNPMTLATFEQDYLRQHGLNLNDFQRFLHQSLATSQLAALVGASGTLVTPDEARMLYVRENEEISAQAAIFSATNYLAGVTNSPEIIGQFYTNQLAAYRLPERVQVSFVEFPVTNYWQDAVAELAKETNFDQQLDDYVLSIGTNYPAGANNAAEAKVILHNNTLRQIAIQKAGKAAAEFASILFTNNNAEAIFKLAQEKNQTLTVTEPFDKDRGPKDFSLPIEFTQAAFNLSPEDPFGGPIVGQNGAYVLAWNKRLPSEIPTFESIHDQVVADYLRVESTQLAREATLKFYSAATNALAAGKSFAAACTEENVRMVALPTFALSTPSLPDAEKEIDLNTLKQAVFGVLPGHLNVIPTQDGGAVVFVNSRLPINEAKLSADMPGFIHSIRQNRQSQAFQIWFGREYSRFLAENPFLQSKDQ